MAGSASAEHGPACRSARLECSRDVAVAHVETLLFELWFALTLCAVATRLLDAQTTSAELRGIIRDPTGAVIPRVEVVVKNIATGALTVHCVE